MLTDSHKDHCHTKSDIVIYTNKKTLLHKQGRGEINMGEYYYWTLRKLPKRTKIYDRIYFAHTGYVRGSFLILEINPGDEETIVWNCNSWKPTTEKIPTSHYQNFKYRWWKNEED